MIEIRVERGGTGFNRSVEGIAAHTREGLERAWWMSSRDIHTEFTRQVKDKASKTGNIYFRRVNGRRRRHQASAPGQTPANMTGVYRKGFNFNVRGATELAVFNEAPHAGWLEVGTSRMQPRPGLSNAINASHSKIIHNLATEIENYI